MRHNSIEDRIDDFKQLEEEFLLKKGNLQKIKQDIRDTKIALKKARHNVKLYEETAEYLRKISLFLREGTKHKIETIVTEALNEIFTDKDLEFFMRFEEKRNVNNLDFIIKEGDKELSILDGCGYGPMNVVATILRIIFIELQSSKPTCIILDEPAVNLSKQYQANFGRFLSILSERLGHQLIIVTHKQDIASQCHKMISVKQNKKGISVITEDE